MGIVAGDFTPFFDAVGSVEFCFSPAGETGWVAPVGTRDFGKSAWAIPGFMAEEEIEIGAVVGDKSWFVGGVLGDKNLAAAVVAADVVENEIVDATMSSSVVGMIAHEDSESLVATNGVVKDLGVAGHLEKNSAAPGAVPSICDADIVAKDVGAGGLGTFQTEARYRQGVHDRISVGAGDGIEMGGDLDHDSGAVIIGAEISLDDIVTVSPVEPEAGAIVVDELASANDSARSAEEL